MSTPETWTVLGMVRWSTEYLEGKGVAGGSARLDAEHLLGHALGTTRLQLYLQHDRPLTPEELAIYKPLLLRRAGREPLQYILGRGAFRELDLRVDPRVLIPRPETEELVDAVLEWSARRAGLDGRPLARAVTRTALPWKAEDGTEAGPPPPDEPDAVPEGDRVLTGLDIGTGSGCIALSLALEGPFRRVVATDVSGDALNLARENARDAGLAGRVEFREGDLFAAAGDERFDVVVSNPPYVAETDAGDLDPEVRDHEPGRALFAGQDGLGSIRRLVAGAADHVEPGGLLALEMGLDQAPAVAGLVRDTGAFEEPRIRRDLAGRPRMVLAVRNN